MIFDIAIIVILILFVIHGFRKGFLFTLIHAVGWMVALAGSAVAVTHTKSFLKENGFIYDGLMRFFTDRFNEQGDMFTPAVSSMPSELGGILDSMIDGLSVTFAAGMADIAYSVILYILFFILIKFVMWLILRIFSRKYSDGFTGIVDGVFGAAAGLLCGAVFVLVILLLLIPASNIMSPELTSRFAAQMDSSVFTSYLYDNNILYDVIRGVLELRP